MTLKTLCYGILLISIGFSRIPNQQLLESAENVLNIYRDSNIDDYTRICPTMDLLAISQYGQSLPNHLKDELKQLGFDFSKSFVTNTLSGRGDVINGLDQYHVSGIFRLHYTLTGSNAVDSTDNDENSIPDYIDRISETFDSVYTQLILDTRYSLPPSDNWYPLGTENGGSDHYDVYIRNLTSGYYGYVKSEYYANESSGDNEHTTIVEKNAVTSYMAIRNNYQGGFPNSEIENIQVTIAHEFFHAIQYGYDFWEQIWLLEATAVWMEEEIYTDVNDCYQYMPSWFSAPENSLKTVSGVHEYGTYIFFKFIEEHWGGGKTIKNIFDESISRDSQGKDYSIIVIDEALRSAGASFKMVFNQMSIANYLLSDNANEYSYEEAGAYRAYPWQIKIHMADSIFYSGKDSLYYTSTNRLEAFASEYIKLNSQVSTIIALNPLLNSAGDLQLNGIIKLRNGEVIIKSGPSIMVNNDLDIDEVVLNIVSLNSQVSTYDYEISIEKLIDPDEFVLAYGGINPFNPQMQPFRFSVDVMNSRNYTIEVYNLLGQLVYPLYSGDLKKGTEYSFLWNGKNLNGLPAAAGMYIIHVNAHSTGRYLKLILLD